MNTTAILFLIFRYSKIPKKNLEIATTIFSNHSIRDPVLQYKLYKLNTGKKIEILSKQHHTSSFYT